MLYEVITVHDYMLKIFAPSLPEYRDFVVNAILSIAGVSKVETMMVLKVEKQQFALPITED